MPKKTFKEYINYVGGFGLSYAHSAIKPIASLGDTPPKSHKFGRTSAGVNLNADTKRVPKKAGQKDKSDKHSDLYTDEDPKGTIHTLGFTDGAKARQSVNKIKNSGRTHAHKIQAAIAMSQRAKVASQRAKDPQKKKDLGQAHRVYQRYIDTNKKSKD
jgi:hypothetical protein